MNPLRIVKDYLVILVDILKISSPLEFGNAYIEAGVNRGITVNLPYAYGNSSFLRRLGMRSSVVNIYPNSQKTKICCINLLHLFSKKQNSKFFVLMKIRNPVAKL